MIHRAGTSLQNRVFRPGDWAIYRKSKQSPTPGPRAMDVFPSRGGEDYSYIVDKFWLVADADEQTVTVTTRRGKQHVLDIDDPNLRLANWWERLRYRKRFQQLEDNAE